MEIDKAKINPLATAACKRLQDHGFKAYLVGGCVRDLLMGVSPKDWDITTNATPEQSMEIFPKNFPSGIEHGTITAILGPSKEEFEITTFRTEGSYSNGRSPDSVSFVQSVDDDLSRRDLTINAIAYDPVSGEIVDPFGGLKDIQNKVIKAVGNPDTRFLEDGLRTLRVARFASRFGFSVDESTKDAIANNLSTLSKVSKERVRDELLKTLRTPDPATGLHILMDSGAIQVMDPLLANLSNSVIDSLNNCNGSIEVKLALLLSDFTIQDVVACLKRLKCSNSEVKKVSFLLSCLEKYKIFEASQDKVSARKFLSFVKDNAPDSYELSLNDFVILAKCLDLGSISSLEKFFNDKVISRKELNISGNDLISRLEMKPGPTIKQTLDKLYDAVKEDPELNNTETLLELAKKFEKIANYSLSMVKKAQKDWWRLSDSEEDDLLNKEYDFGNGLKFKPKDIPDLAKMVEIPAGPEAHHPEKNQLLHNNLVFDKAKEKSDDPMVWFGAALHDLGKSYTDPALFPKHHGHEEGGVIPVEKLSDMLGVPDDWKEFASLVADNHLRCHTSGNLTEKSLKKLFSLFKNDREKFDKFILSCESDAQGRLGNFSNERYPQRDALLRKWDEGFEDKSSQKSDLAISGNDLMDLFDLKPGKELGNIMKKLKEAVKDDPNLNDKHILVGLAKQLLR